MGVIKDFIELIKGLQITGKHLGRHAVTIQYPKEKMEMFERSRGIVVLLSDKETGDLNCTACMLCMKICPTAAIRIDAPMDENKRKQLQSFTVDNALCCYCGLCEEACNFDAIKLAAKYEWSVETVEETMWDIKQLQEVGRDVPYEVTRQKKPAKPKPKPKTGEAKSETAAKDTAEKAETKASEQPAKEQSTEDTKKTDTENSGAGSDAPQQDTSSDEEKKD